MSFFRNKYTASLFLIVTLVACEKGMDIEMGVHIIPQPKQVEITQGSINLNAKSTLYLENEFENAASFLRNYLRFGAGLNLELASKDEATIIFIKDDSIPSEGYILEVSEKNILIKASDSGGAFYGVQTLRQLMPSSLERNNSIPNQTVTIPTIRIIDAPKFKYRGMHLDVGRHFFPKEFIKEYIANMALLKMNYFHWHLTEDQGWRIEIKKYPRLSSHAAFRNETLIGHYNDSPQKYDGKTYGGFYTQEEIKEIVEFASQHNVTIIPEIEMPGHAQAAISAYPELGCTGKAVEVATKWGVFENIYCPNQNTFTFLQDVLIEVIALFPGEYIHIGGDEAPKTQWQKCDHCQQLIEKHNLKDEHGLQSYFIREMEAFINSKGKKIIGWDEILEGGLAPNATVMSWRGTEGGIEAAKQQHDVIMTPTSHAYFDYYQSENPDEPLAIGGFLPLKKVYSFNPLPDDLNEEEKQYILGAQGNVWTEYMKTEEQVEYMAFPRMLAMSEVVWSGPSENIDHDYTNFLARLELFMERLDVRNINYANHLYEIQGNITKESGNVFYTLKTPTEGKEILYSINNSEEKNYEAAIPITGKSVITAIVHKDGKEIGSAFSEEINFHKGVIGTLSLNLEPHKAYSAGGKEALINGISGSDSRYGDKEWLGFWGDDLEIKIDWKELQEINMVTLRLYNANGQWIYLPDEVTITFKTENGKTISSMQKTKPNAGSTIVTISVPFDSIKTEGITITIPSYGTIPDGKQGAGNMAWTFIDEITIE